MLSSCRAVPLPRLNLEARAGGINVILPLSPEETDALKVEKISSVVNSAAAVAFGQSATGKNTAGSAARFRRLSQLAAPTLELKNTVLVPLAGVPGQWVCRVPCVAGIAPTRQ